MASRITRVALRDYRSFASCDVELQPLTFLVGPNGSGKSNFLDALRFLAQSMHAPIEEAVRARSGIEAILHKVPRGRFAGSFSIQVGFQINDADTSGTYAMTVSEGPQATLSIDEERCQVGPHSFTSTRGSVEHTFPAAPVFTGNRPALVSFGALPEFAPVFDLIAGLTFYSPDPERMKRLTSPGPGKLLSPDASNAADVVARLTRSKSGIMARLREYLAAFNPEFMDLEVLEAGGYRWLGFTNTSQWTFNSSSVSDGTLRALGILLAIFQADATPPVSLVGLEEPESNLHPAAAGVLMDALLEASRSVPILASTHSADLLDRKDLPENAILAVAMHEGETVIGPISDGEKAILHRGLYTAGELLRSSQLTPTAATTDR